ncbi:MAG: signal peptidase II [Zoogloeaceae bacterium]|nr:signal peptidase II [Zoogloeaceae bacterium]
MSSRSSRFAAWLALAGLVVALDQASKAWVLAVFQAGESLAVAPVFNLTLLFNAGASFSFLADAGGWQRWFFIALALAVSAWLILLLRAHAAGKDQRLLSCALALILGGAIGNVIDRIRIGAVTDFLDFHWAGHHFPAFNIADACITLGVILMIWHELFKKRKLRP